MAQSYKTAIEFGLVYIPISLHACVKSHDIGFNMLYKKTKQRIKYRKTCENCPANISSDDIVKGYEYQPGKYVTLSDEELEKIKSPKILMIAGLCGIGKAKSIRYFMTARFTPHRKVPTKPFCCF